MGLDPQPDNLVVLVEGHLRMRDVVAAMRVGEERFRTVASPLHRTADLLRRPQRHHLFRIDVDLGAEAAADIGRDHAQLVLRRNVVERRQHEAGDVRILRGGVKRVVLFGSVVVGHRRPRLHRIGN